MKNLLLFIVVLPLIGFSQSKRPKNVILLIGDGMGISQLSSAYFFEREKEPNFSRFPFVGLIKISSAKEDITDSAAGATAFACGVKTYNGAISVDTFKNSIPTLIEVAELRGVKTGLIATSSITHATPACFYAHEASRSMSNEIAVALSTSGVDFFAGGGLKFFQNREDGRDLMNELAANGYRVNTKELDAEKDLKEKSKYGYLLAQDGLASKLEGRKEFLSEATHLALSYLSKGNTGFFLMVEGSQIDWEGHSMNAEGVIQEVRDFDNAIGVALDFAEENGGTLVIVTADHETGGFALSPMLNEGSWDYEHIKPTFYQDANKVAYSAHTATLIPVLTYGPYSQYFSGIYENTGIFHKIINATNWKQKVIQNNGSTSY